ncbi:MAG: GGDEF domain-containing protein [Aquamicrobium sp.]|uniref:GGDEF domain-containing protein n=1 Tax=Aquamicrobium sp. TaxID=1872579 RepID=UPI00349EEB47|nr:GGDEF domain-containing protein [Aquamicrobium sp.]
MNSKLFISLVNPIMVGVFTCMFACIWLRIRKPYLGYVTAACGIATVMFLVQSFWPFEDAQTNVVVINVSLLAVIVLLSGAALVRAGQALPIAAFLAISVCFLTAVAWFVYVQPSLPARLHIANMAMVAIMALTLRGQLRARTSHADTILIGVSSMCAFYFVWRSVSFFLFEAESLQFGTFTIDLFWTMNLLMTLVMAVVLAIGYIVVLAHDLYDQIRKEAHTDQLSGILNRRGFESAALSWLEENREAPATLVIADIDHFKTINDTWGHAAGDQAISRFGQLLAQHAGEGYVVGRIGGEEFAVLIPRGSAQEARVYVETIRRVLCRQPIPGMPEDFRFTVSFGLRSRSSVESLSDMLRGADRALYSAKADGRDTVSVELGAVKAAG